MNRPEQRKLFTAVSSNLIPDRLFYSALTLIKDEQIRKLIADLHGQEWRSWMGERGTLPKRIASHIKKIHGVKVLLEELSDMGVVLSEFKHEQRYFFEFDNNSDWAGGDFNEPDTEVNCWCTKDINDPMRIRHRPGTSWPPRITGQFFRAGGLALKFYESEDAYYTHRMKGIGRCWMWDMGNMWVTFNHRGDIRGSKLQSMSVVGEFLGGLSAIMIPTRITTSPYVDNRWGIALVPHGYVMPELCLIDVPFSPEPERRST